MKYVNGEKYEVVLKDCKMIYGGEIYYKNGKFYEDNTYTTLAGKRKGYEYEIKDILPFGCGIVKYVPICFIDMNNEKHDGFFNGKCFISNDKKVKLDSKPVMVYKYKQSAFGKFLKKVSRKFKSDLINYFPKSWLFKKELNDEVID